MFAYIVQRIAISLSVLVVISIAVFGLLQITPGDPAEILINPLQFQGDQDAAMKAIREQLGLDQPVYVQYFKWVTQMLQGDWGFSFVSRQPVRELILGRLGPTSVLMLTSLAIALVVGVTVGVAAAMRQGKPLDHAATLMSLLAISVPPFFVALVGIYVFGLKLGWLPTAGMNTPDGGLVSGIKYLALPALILGLSMAAGIIRWSRASMLDVLNQDYMTTARAKGLPAARIIVSHGLRNALIPLITVVALTIPSLLGGAVIIEQIFAWPGMGRLVVSSIGGRDYPVLLAFIMIVSVVVLLCNLLADLLYAVADPRVRLTRGIS